MNNNNNNNNKINENNNNTFNIDFKINISILKNDFLNMFQKILKENKLLDEKVNLNEYFKNNKNSDNLIYEINKYLENLGYHQNIYKLILKEFLNSN
jgi:hypothetical protein